MVPSRELRAALDRALSEHFEAEHCVVRLDRRPSPYRSSFALEDLRAVLDDGTTLRLVFKDLSWRALSRGAQKVKPSFLYDPLREIYTYRSILAPAKLETATYYGATVDHERQRYWLFLEKVPGVGLWQEGDLATWKQAACWLANLHDRFAGEMELRCETKHLVRYDAAFYRLWLRRAQLFTRQNEAMNSGGVRRALTWLATRYDKVVERLMALPVTFIHGEFYASNVLVAGTGEARRVCPIDWEIAAIGPSLIDLAALTTGAWGSEERRALALAYRAGRTASVGSRDAFLTALDHCRLHLAMQWLGWAPNWTPPPEHRHDWLAEALRVAEELDL